MKQRTRSRSIYRLGIDTGGTFTDFACLDPSGAWRRWKVLSTPKDPSKAILEGISRLVEGLGAREIELVHGTTVGTNAFLERKGAKTVLITTKGFEDVIWIGRQARPSLYDLNVQRFPDITPRKMVTGLEERLDWQGNVLASPAPEELERIYRFCKYRGAESVAVCLLHSYASPIHEKAVKRVLEPLGIPVSTSHEVLSEFREFERFSTTLINAYLNPVVGRYIRRLHQRLPKARIYVQLSNGGALPALKVEERAVHTLLSGPAGGVQAAWRLGSALGTDKIITLDMGGTSTDVSICPGKLTFTREYELEGYPVAIPMLDIHTVGAGGGSVAWLDRGGFLQVGPESAGADPGPVCYGKGTQITVTDANLFLGRLRESSFLGGRMKLEKGRMERAMANLASRVGLSPLETAKGIIDLVNANMSRAIRRVSLERGYDPRDFTLVCFGGAAGLHAAELADALEITRVIIPAMAGVFSAQGMAQSTLSFDKSRSIIVKDGLAEERRIAEEMRSLVSMLEEESRAIMEREGGGRMQRFIDVRYKGQSFEITVPFEEGWPERFAQEHRRLYGYDLMGETLEVTTIRARLEIQRSSEAPVPDPSMTVTSSSGGVDRAKVFFRDGAREATVLARQRLGRDGLDGPAVITDDYTTILVPPGWRASGLKGHLELARTN